MLSECMRVFDFEKKHVLFKIYSFLSPFFALYLANEILVIPLLLGAMYRLKLTLVHAGDKLKGFRCTPCPTDNKTFWKYQRLQQRQKIVLKKTQLCSERPFNITVVPILPPSNVRAWFSHFNASLLRAKREASYSEHSVIFGCHWQRTCDTCDQRFKFIPHRESVQGCH